MSLIPSRTQVSATKSLALAAILAAIAGCDKASPTAPDKPNKLIVVTAPAAGSTFKAGDSLTVKWTVRDDPTGAGRTVTAVNVSLSPDGGMNWGSLNQNGSVKPKNGQWLPYKWLIPDSLYIQDLNQKIPLKGSHNCIVQVQDYNSSDADVTDTSGVFTVSP